MICDPWLATIPIYGNTAVKYPFMPAELTAEAIDVSHIYISHHHEDHFHVPTLDLYPRDVTVLIPAFEYVAHPRAASMLRTLQLLGFENVVALRSWQTIEIDLGETLSLTLIPSAQSRWHDWENSGLILRSADWTALNLNDNLVDDALLGEISVRSGRPDVVFVQGFPSTEFPGAFDFSVREKISIGRQKRGNVAQAQTVINHLGPRCVIPIAGDIAWHRHQDLYRNYSDKATPSRFGPVLGERGLLTQTECIDLAPGDWLNPSTLLVERPYGHLQYAGFRRRLRSKMTRFARLVTAYDAYGGPCEFEVDSLRNLASELRDYFPREFPVAATVRIDFVLVTAVAEVLARISFCIRGRDLRISVDTETGMDCNQEIIVPEAMWFESIQGRVLRRDLFNLCINRQLTPFQPAVAALRYFITYYFDFGDISPWIRISRPEDSGESLVKMRSLRSELSPQFSAVDLRDEYVSQSQRLDEQLVC